MADSEPTTGTPDKQARRASEGIAPLSMAGVLRRIRFVTQADLGHEVLLDFPDPALRQAVCIGQGPLAEEKGASPLVEDGIDVLAVADRPGAHPEWVDELLAWVEVAALPGLAGPLVVTVHSAQVLWSPARAAILADAERIGMFLTALVDFGYYENELRKLEREVSVAWPLLERDTPLAYAVPALDRDRCDAVGTAMGQALQRRMRLARIAPHLTRPRPHLTPLANQLADRLREKAHVEERLEALGQQCEVFEYIYEMNSQRISDATAARRGRTLEWAIVVLLASETLLLLLEVLYLFRE